MKNRWIKHNFILFFLVFFLTGCWERDGLAPVEDSHWRDGQGNMIYRHIVRRGETLYAIAFRYDQDYRQLARLNHIASPYTVRVGQVLQIRGKHNSIKSKWKPKSIPRFYAPSQPIIPRYQARYGQWIWPVKGRLVSSFIPQQGKKGIDIAGHKGDKIRASASGVVAYAGEGLSGYGNLIIIKHNNQFLTAYGNNSRNLVIEGQHIQAGQVIAEMGVVDHRYWGMHFEIRHAGHPVNPLQYLQR